MPKIKDICEKYGTEKVFAMIPLRPLKIAPFGLFAFTVGSDPEYDVFCRIDETRYKISENYKVTFKAIDERFGQRHYYQSDFNHMVRVKQIIVLVTVNDEFDYPEVKEGSKDCCESDEDNAYHEHEQLDCVIVSGGVKHIANEYIHGEDHVTLCNETFYSEQQGKGWEAFEDFWLEDITCPKCKQALNDSKNTSEDFDPYAPGICESDEDDENMAEENEV